MPQTKSKAMIVIKQHRIDLVLGRIDQVLKDNRRVYWIHTVLASVLFLCGIVCMIVAIIRGQLVWSIPTVFTTAMLHWPLKVISKVRQQNISLAVAPGLIGLLPSEDLAFEVKQLLKKLYEQE